MRGGGEKSGNDEGKAVIYIRVLAVQHGAVRGVTLPMLTSLTAAETSAIIMSNTDMMSEPR